MTDDVLNEWLNERFVGAKDLAKGHTHKFDLQFARDLIAFAHQQEGWSEVPRVWKGRGGQDLGSHLERRGADRPP